MDRLGYLPKKFPLDSKKYRQLGLPPPLISHWIEVRGRGFRQDCCVGAEQTLAGPKSFVGDFLTAHNFWTGNKFSEAFHIFT